MRMNFMKRRSSTASTKMMVLAISIILLLSTAVMGTMMFLVSKTPVVTNTFAPAKVTCEVQEQFDGTVKKEYQQYRCLSAHQAGFLQSQY